jgi:hypothetical protein
MGVISLKSEGCNIVLACVSILFVSLQLRQAARQDWTSTRLRHSVQVLRCT